MFSGAHYSANGRSFVWPGLSPPRFSDCMTSFSALAEKFSVVLAYVSPFLISPFKPCMPFSGTRLNDDLLGVACVGYFTVAHQSVQAHSAQLIPGEPWTFRLLLLAASFTPAPQALEHKCSGKIRSNGFTLQQAGWMAIPHSSRWQKEQL